jgi:hypothetical protein
LTVISTLPSPSFFIIFIFISNQIGVFSTSYESFFSLDLRNSCAGIDVQELRKIIRTVSDERKSKRAAMRRETTSLFDVVSKMADSNDEHLSFFNTSNKRLNAKFLNSDKIDTEPSGQTADAAPLEEDEDHLFFGNALSNTAVFSKDALFEQSEHSLSRIFVISSISSETLSRSKSGRPQSFMDPPSDSLTSNGPARFLSPPRKPVSETIVDSPTYKEKSDAIPSSMTDPSSSNRKLVNVRSPEEAANASPMNPVRKPPRAPPDARKDRSPLRKPMDGSKTSLTSPKAKRDSLE